MSLVLPKQMKETFMLLAKLKVDHFSFLVLKLLPFVLNSENFDNLNNLHTYILKF